MSNLTIPKAFENGLLPEKEFGITCKFCGQPFVWTRPAGTPACMESFFPNCHSGCAPTAETASVVNEAMAYWRMITPKLYQDTDRNKLPVGPGPEGVFSWQYNIGGLLAFGETGTGKTRSVFLLLKRLCQEGKRPLVFTPIEFSHAVAEHMRGSGGRAWIESLSERDLLVFDDLGKGKLTDRVESELFGLIDKRIANMLPTIITTNLTGDTMEGVMTKDRAIPLVRRFREPDYFTTVSFGTEQKGTP